MTKKLDTKGPTAEQAQALLTQQALHGRNWKRVLNRVWFGDREARSYESTMRDLPLLMQVRNTLGPSWLADVTIKQIQDAAPHTPANPWGALYGSTVAYVTTDGREVWMHRKRQAVRFYDAKGEQVGPEQTNVAPAVASAIDAGWHSPGMPRWMEEQGQREIRANKKKIIESTKPRHSTDADCEPHLVDDTCTVCGVGRTDACPRCGGCSYHNEGCTSADAGGGVA